MASYLKNVIILGASGNIGKLILNGFLGDSRFNVTALTRKASNVFPAGINVRPSDYSQEDLIKAFTGQDVVISVMGMEGFSEQKRFVDAAIAAGVKRFMPSEFSFNSLAPGVQELLPPVVDQKRDLLNYLAEKTKSSTLSWTAIWTALLLDWCLENGLMEFNLKAKTATIWDDGNTKFTLTNVKQMQRAIVAVLERPEETVNRGLYIASVETTQNQILKAAEGAIGPFTITRTTTEKEITEGKEALAKGDFGGVMKLVRGTSFADLPGLHANYTQEKDFANDILGLEMESLGDTIKQALAAVDSEYVMPGMTT